MLLPAKDLPCELRSEAEFHHLLEPELHQRLKREF